MVRVVHHFFPGTYKTTFSIKASYPLANSKQKALTAQVASLSGSIELATRHVFSANLFDTEN